MASEPSLQVVLAPRALRDLEGIAEFLTARSPIGARNVLSSIKRTIENLSHSSGLGSRVDAAGHRRMPLVSYPYVIFYRVAGSELVVLHIRHSSRRPLDPEGSL